MMRRLLANPALIVLAAVVFISVIGTVWGVQMSMTSQDGMSWTGEPSEEQLWQFRLMRISGSLPPIATFVGVAAVLGILVIASASRRRTIRPDPRG
ncbi:hypothetical protein ESP57_09145 [Agromyces fucosus]|uniref:Uncharacterized protein n=1 Tax=Agromyces fucosus TaxID=41985 RepID=A0A4Q2JMA6_9MICO|nr:hypothetical protein [Agromyces fucosus]RXZ49102.1 hypothetical protein ESP57_09145 [Agromyces fucosus]